MGMSTDEAIKHGKEQLEIFGGEHKEFIETSIDTMRKYQMFQAKYAERLKADMVAMLMDLCLLFEDCQTVEECFGILNKRIADLKGEAQE